MKTRTLLVLAVSCGLVILVAGALLLLQLSNQDAAEPALEVGDTAQLGDAVVTVERVNVSVDAIDVIVTISGVNDADGVGGFTLIAPAEAISAEPPVEGAEATDPPLCAGFTIEPTTCLLRFIATDLAGSERQLLFQRAAEHVRWRLA